MQRNKNELHRTDGADTGNLISKCKYVFWKITGIIFNVLFSDGKTL